jgi:hypothetical protein
MTCTNPDCCPVEQIRGEMGPGDYYDVIAHNRIPVPGAVPEPEKYGFPIYDRSEQRQIAVPHLEYGQLLEPDPNDTRAFEVPSDVRPEHCVEMSENNKTDFRICCKTCGKATPWGAQDIPGMPGAGADWTRKRWNEAA